MIIIGIIIMVRTGLTTCQQSVMADACARLCYEPEPGDWLVWVKVQEKVQIRALLTPGPPGSFEVTA